MHFAERYAVNRPSVIFDVQGGETVIIDLSTGHYYRLGADSTALWMRFDSATSAEEILAACDNRDDLESVLPAALEDLLAKGLITPTESPRPSASDRWHFEGFILEEFTDLEDILGLDPIHEVDPERGWPHVKEA